jgi:hypothetical protein
MEAHLASPSPLAAWQLLVLEFFSPLRRSSRVPPSPPLPLRREAAPIAAGIRCIRTPGLGFATRQAAILGGLPHLQVEETAAPKSARGGGGRSTLPTWPAPCAAAEDVQPCVGTGMASR